MTRPCLIQLLPALEGGGVERGTLEIAAEAVRRGYRSIVVSGGGRWTSELIAGGSEHVEMDIGRKSLLSLRQVRPLRRLFAETGADIVHARSRLPAWLTYLAWRRMPPGRRPRFVTTVHGLYSVNPYSAIMTRGEAVTAVSATTRDYILSNYPATPPDRVRLIPNGIDQAAFPPGYRPDPQWLQKWEKDFPQLQGRKVLTLPGRISRIKGQDDFVQLIAALKARGMPVHGLIVGGLTGSEKYREEIDARIREFGLEGDITFTGQRGDMRDIYSASDLVLSLSRKPESFGRTVLEALSLGVPVLGYDHGGVGESLAAVFPAGRTPLGEIEALTERAAALLEAKNHEIAPVPFLLHRNLDETFALYAELQARSD